MNKVCMAMAISFSVLNMYGIVIDFRETYGLMPSLCVDKVGVIHGYLIYDSVSLDQALAIGVLQKYDAMIQEAITKMINIKRHFCVDELLDIIKNSGVIFKVGKGLCAAGALFVLCSGIWDMTKYSKCKPAIYQLMVLEASALGLSLSGYWFMRSEHKKHLRQICERILGLEKNLAFDRSLFAITDMDKTKKVWQEIKSTIDDKVLAGKIEEFFGLKFEY